MPLSNFIDLYLVPSNVYGHEEVAERSIASDERQDEDEAEVDDSSGEGSQRPCSDEARAEGATRRRLVMDEMPPEAPTVV